MLTGSTSPFPNYPTRSKPDSWTKKLKTARIHRSVADYVRQEGGMPLTTMKDEEELKKKIEALENENRALRDAVSRPLGRRNVIVVTEGSYQGHPTISFEASNGRPFTLGLRKAAIVLHCAEQVKRFVAEHKGEIKDWEIVRGSAGGRESDGKTDLQI